MKITNIIEVPKFISNYINNGIEDIDYQLHSFCRFLLYSPITSLTSMCTEDDDNYQIEYTVDETSYDIKYFINFYIKKSKEDSVGNCLYESETNLPKSLSNETFKVELESDDGIKLGEDELYIESFMSDKLILKSI